MNSERTAHTEDSAAADKAAADKLAYRCIMFVISYTLVRSDVSGGHVLTHTSPSWGEPGLPLTPGVNPRREGLTLTLTRTRTLTLTLTLTLTPNPRPATEVPADASERAADT